MRGFSLFNKKKENDAFNLSSKNKEVTIFVEFFVTFSFIMAFPILIKVGIYFFEHGFKVLPQNIGKSLLNVIYSNLPFYATSLSIVFSVFSFIYEQQKSQKKYIEAENKEKQKELENKRDKYRPTFVITDDKKGEEKIVLLMRNNDIYLEEIRFYFNEHDKTEYTYIENLKSGEIVGSKKFNSFFITARTQIGEYVIFGSLNGQVKIHKYLKEAGKPIIPLLGVYSQRAADENWGSYNTLGDVQNREIDSIFFDTTYEYREKMAFNYYQSIASSLETHSAENFFQSIFENLHGSNDFEFLSKIKVIKIILNNIQNAISYFNLHINELPTDYLIKIEKRLDALDIEYLDYFQNENQKVDLYNFILHIDKQLSNLLKYDKDMEINEYINGILELLLNVFKNVTVDRKCDKNLPFYKEEIFNNLVFKK